MVDFMLGMCDYKGHGDTNQVKGMACIWNCHEKIGPVLANWNKKHAFDLKGVHHVDLAASIELELKSYSVMNIDFRKLI